MPKSIYLCQECNHQESKWMGCCSSCGTWNSFQERQRVNKNKKNNLNISSKVFKINEIEKIKLTRLNTGFKELNRILGGGLTKGSLSLIGGEPGVGKSTLLVQVCRNIARNHPKEKVIYISGEESTEQIADRCIRLGITEDNILILHERSFEKMLNVLKKVAPIFVVFDSVQTMVTDTNLSPPGSPGQIRNVIYELMNYSKINQVTSLVIGHITKTGEIAGPKMLEHMVDTVISFSGSGENQYRFLRPIKNRFGITSEVGIFEMSFNGLTEVENPSQCFIKDISENVFGSSLTCLLEGGRFILVEVQSLTIKNRTGFSKKTTQEYDASRLALLVAVIEKNMKIDIGESDIYLNIVGGLRIKSRESDLAVIASVLSSYYSRCLDRKTIFLGEVGLTGELRFVSRMEQRLQEMAALNYKCVILPHSNMMKLKKCPKGLKLLGLKNINELKTILK